MALELSTQPSMPLDFSSSGSNRDNSGSPEVNVSDSPTSSPRGSSAFTIVTPKGREGKTIETFFPNSNTFLCTS